MGILEAPISPVYGLIVRRVTARGEIGADLTPTNEYNCYMLGCQGLQLLVSSSPQHVTLV